MYGEKHKFILLLYYKNYFVALLSRALKSNVKSFELEN